MKNVLLRIKKLLLFFCSVIISEFHPQIAHVTCIISIILILCNVSTYNAIVWSIIFIIYLLTLGICGYRIFWSIDESYNKKIRRIYITMCILLAIIACTLCGIIETLIIVGSLVIMTIIYYITGSALINSTYNFDESKPKLEIIREKHPIIFTMCYVCSILLLILIPTMLLLCSVKFKVIILIGYLLLNPVIIALADNGVDIVNVFFEEY